MSGGCQPLMGADRMRGRKSQQLRELVWLELLSPPAWRAASSLRDAQAMAIELANRRDRATTGHTLVTSRRDNLGNTLG